MNQNEPAQLQENPVPQAEQEPHLAAEVEPEVEAPLEILPIIDAAPTSKAIAQAPSSIPAPQLPEPIEEVLDVAFQVLDVLTTPNPP